MIFHKIIRRKILFMAAGALPFVSKAQTTNPESFEIQVKNGRRLVNEWKHLTQDKEGLWQKNFLFVSNIKYDVVKTASALRPFIGILEVSVLKAAGTKHLTRIEAENEVEIEDAPRVPGGKNAFVLEYDLKFEPRSSGWQFLEGKSRTSLFDDTWKNIPLELARSGEGVSGYIVRSFATPVSTQKKNNSRIRTPSKTQT